MAVMRSKQRPAPPVDDDDDDAPPRSVEDDPRVQRARQRLHDVNAAKARDDDDEDDDDPDDAGADVIHGGWTASDNEQASNTPWAASFVPEDTTQIIKFLDDGPYAAYRRHWVERASASGGRTNRPYTCLKSVKKPCPLCDIGERPQAVSAFNIVIVGEDGQLVLRSWDVGARLLGAIKGFANDPKIGPLTKGFFGVSKSGKKQNTQYNLFPIKASALEEDHDIPVPSDKAIASVEKYSASIVEIPKTRDLRQIAEELADDYD